MLSILIKFSTKSVIFCLISLLDVLYTQNYWLRQNSPTDKKLVKCFFTDSLYGWVAGDSGIIIHTSSAGSNWIVQQSGHSNYTIEDIFFVNRNTGWTISNDYLFIGTFINKTTNGGANWIVSRFPDSNLVLNTVFFIDSLNGFIAGQSGRIFRTSNGGINWFLCGIDSTSCPHLLPKYDIYFINQQTGFACGGAIDYTGVIWKTLNGGLNWTPLCLTPEPLNVIKHTGNNKVAIMGGDFEFGASIVYSTSSGSFWNYSLINCLGWVTGFSLRTPAECWAALGLARVLIVNTDSLKPGTNWLCLPSPDNEEIHDIWFTSPTLGWAFGSNGSIFKYNTSVIGTNNQGNKIPSGYYLDQNYPNPFNPVTRIRFYVPQSDEVKNTEITLKIYDALGREVETLLSLQSVHGIYGVEWKGNNFPSGVYIYRLIVTEQHREVFSISRKMVLIK